MFMNELNTSPALIVGYIIVIGIIIGYIIHTLITGIKTHKAAKAYRTSIANGDTVDFVPIINSRYKAVVVDVCENHIQITLEVDRNRIYPHGTK
jgi:hypothetical protein